MGYYDQNDNFVKTDYKDSYYLNSEDDMSYEAMEAQYAAQEYSEGEMEQLRAELMRTEEEYDNWNIMSRNIVDMETAYEYDIVRNIENIDRMCEICGSSDVYLKSLWEAKASILNSIRHNTRDFQDIFEEEDRKIREDYETRLNKLHEDIGNY